MTVQQRHHVLASGSGPATLFFCHGFGCDQHMWRLMAPAFAGRFRTVAFDLVGAGLSDLAAYEPEKYSSLQGHADDVLEIIREFGQGPCVLVGHSLGATIGLLADLTLPGQIAAHAMICPSPSFINEGDYVGGFERHEIEALLAAMDSNYLAWASTIAPALMGASEQPALSAELASSLCRMDPDIARQLARVTFLADHRAKLARLQTPALVLQCRQDAFVPPAVGPYMQRVMPRAQLRIIDNVGHCPHLSSPALTAEAINAFLALQPFAAPAGGRPLVQAQAQGQPQPPESEPATTGQPSLQPLPQAPAGQGLPPAQQALLDEAACALAQTADDGVFLHVNAALCDWLGYRPGELLGQRTLQDLLTPGSRLFYQSHSVPLLHLKGSVAEVRLDMLRKDGRTLPMLLNARRHHSQGVAVHELALFIAQDRDRYEQALIASRHQLQTMVEHATELETQARERALFAEQMVGIVSHDLRNPVSAILMSATLLEREALNARQAEILQRILKVGQRASRLITDLLDITQARLGSGLAVAPAPIDLHATVAEAVQELAQAYPERLLRHVRQGAGACVADADRLAQLVVNLVSNALAYGATQAPVVVTSRIEADSFSIAVANDGEPIAPETLPRLFTLMVRGGGTTPANHGIGLGLFIVSEIAKAHGGTASVASTREGGTVFSVTLPRTGPPAPPEAAQNPS